MDSEPKITNTGSRGDRISSLPDELIIYILSLMSTRDAFRTSLLSSRWEKLWTFVPSLSFCPFHGKTEGWIIKKFNPPYMNFVDKILLLHTSSIHRFDLNSIPRIDKSRVSAWLSTVVQRNVREITIFDGYCPKIWLPRSLFTCQTLEILKLDQYLQFNIPSSVYLPRLRVLHLTLSTPSKDLSEKLFCSSPVLEELKLKVKDDSGRSKYIISSPALKKLSIVINAGKLEHYGTVVIIDAPALEFLNVENECFVHYSFKNLSSLSKAYLNIDVIGQSGLGFGDPIRLGELRMLLVALSNVKNLSLGCLTVDALGYNNEKEWPVLPNITRLDLEIREFRDPNNFSKWPKFPRVSHLLLDVYNFGSTNFSKFLAVVPNLHTLEFERVPYVESLDEGIEQQWEVPTCLRFCLRNIEVYEVGGYDDEQELIKYFLVSSQVLEKLTFKQCKIKKKLQAVIRAMPRSSKNSEVVFL